MPHWTAPLEVRPFRPEERDLWRRLMATHHCLGFRGLVGESLYYVACVENEWVASLGWAAATWMCRPRDQWIGWTGAQQWARLRLILPEVRVPNLASKVLSQHPAPERRLAARLRSSSGAGRNLCGPDSLRRHELSGLGVAVLRSSTTGTYGTAIRKACG
ncbi:MAG: Druantia anti-phage system protein DruA [Sulfobacillus sp.]